MNNQVPPSPFSTTHHTATGADDSGDSSESGASRRGPGRPTLCTPQMLGMLRGLIRELGLSPNAAAERMGISASTLSRWRRKQPEVALSLKQAREECRALHLQRIIETSQAEGGKGWRASAWILERLFPEDYAPSATQRQKFRAIAERQREVEEQGSEEAEVEDLLEAARASAECPLESTDDLEPIFANEDESPEADEQEEVHSESDCQNGRNSTSTARELTGPGDPRHLHFGTDAPNVAQEEHRQNCQNPASDPNSGIAHRRE